MSPSSLRFSASVKSLALGLGVLALGACGKKAPPPPEPSKDPATTTAITSAVAPAPSASAASTDRAKPDASSVPVLTYKPFEKANVRHELFPIDNAVLVTDFARIGRLVPDSDKIDWIGKLPEGHSDSRYVTEAAGTWPDRVDIGWSFDGRSPSPSYLPLTGNGNAFAIPAGGKMTDPEGMSTAGIDFGGVIGIATIGPTTLLAYQSYEIGTAFRVVRGPNVKRKSSSLKEAGCTDGEVEKLPSGRWPVGVVPQNIGATPKGTLLALGQLCGKRGLAVEVWDDKGKSTIVKLPDGHDGVSSRIYGTKDDEAVLFGPGRQAPLRFANGAFEKLAAPPVELKMVFVSSGPERKLHGSDGETVYRLSESGWAPIARFDGFPGKITAIAGDGKSMWIVRDERVGRVTTDAAATSAAWREDCATPFVFLYDVAAKNETNYTFPTTRKALSSFAEATDLGLVETNADGQRKLGVTVKSKAQGEALIEHLRMAMKDEKPELLCLAAKGRVIAIQGK